MRAVERDRSDKSCAWLLKQCYHANLLSTTSSKYYRVDYRVDTEYSDARNDSMTCPLDSNST
jgi:hypothetical protein